jgi:hypothetical protein
MALHVLVWLVFHSVVLPTSWVTLLHMANMHHFDEWSVFSYIVLPVNALAQMATEAFTKLPQDRKNRGSQGYNKLRYHYTNKYLVEYATDYIGRDGGFPGSPMTEEQLGKKTNDDVSRSMEQAQSRTTEESQLGACYQLYYFHVSGGDTRTTNITITAKNGLVHETEMQELLEFVPTKQGEGGLAEFVRAKFYDENPPSVAKLTGGKRKGDSDGDENGQKAKKTRREKPDVTQINELLSEILRLSVSEKTSQERMTEAKVLGQRLVGLALPPVTNWVLVCKFDDDDPANIKMDLEKATTTKQLNGQDEIENGIEDEDEAEEE